MSEQREKLHRIERLAEIRQAYMTAAEVRVREAEQQLRQREEAAADADGQIRLAREEIAHLQHVTGAAIQNHERYIWGLHVRARKAHEAVDAARKVLDRRRQEWRETRREQKVVVNVQERRLLEWQQSVDVAEQKFADTMSVARHVRNHIHHDKLGTAVATTTETGESSH